MKLIVSGTRTITDEHEILIALEDADIVFGPIDTLLHGDCRGVDRTAAEIGKQFGWDVEARPADWESHRKGAGPRRNREMAKEGDALVAVWDGESRGTRDMIDKAVIEGIPVLVKVVQTEFDVSI